MDMRVKARIKPAKRVKLAYQRGFGNSFSSEAAKGALPVGQNSPQRPPRGLYAEAVSGSAFTAPRAENLNAWLYKLRPSAMHGPYAPIGNGLLRSGPFDEVKTPPNRLRWNPLPIPSKPTDFIDGLVTIAGSGDPAAHSGMGVHVYCANRSMTDRYFHNADGEMMIIPQQGGLLIFSELGKIEAKPGEIAVLPRGMKFKVGLLDGPSADGGRGVRGYVCENYGAPFRLPELGPIGSMLELTQGGGNPIALPTGETRAFLEDGDEVIQRSRCVREGFASIGFGEAAGMVRPAPRT